MTLENAQQKITPQYHLQNDDILYFLHIPKTAGTTVTSIIDGFFDYESIFPHKVWPALIKNRPNSFEGFKFIRGHFGYGLHQILKKKPIYMTMLRKPIDRTISNFDHIQNFSQGTTWVSEKFVKKGESLVDVLNDPKRRAIFKNSQTRLIGLDLGTMMSSSKILRELQKDDSFLETISSCKQPSDDKLLEIAKNRLSEFAYVGIVEKLQESLFLMYYTFGWKPIYGNWKMMVTGKTKKDQLTENEIDAIKNCTYLDSELYLHAQQLFEKRYSQMVEDLKEKYFKSSFDEMPFEQMIYQMLELHYLDRRAVSNETPKTSIDYNFKQKLYGNGWYYREILENGDACRWTGPQTKSTIDFLLEPKDYKISFRVIAVALPDILSNLKLKVNHNYIPTIIKEQTNEKTIFEGNIPKSAINYNKITTITFETSKTVPINQKITPLIPQTRNLGLAFDQISIL